MKKKSEENSEESIRLDEIRHVIVSMAFDECKHEVALLLEEMNDLYFQWIDRIVEESREFLIENENEVIAVEEPNSNVVHVDFGKKE